MGLGKPRNKRFSTWLLPAFLALAGLVIAAGGDPFGAVLRYDRAAIDDGEFYRLITGHLVHLGWSHLLLNAAGLVLVWVLVGTAWRPSQWFAILVMTIAGLDLGFWTLMPELRWYVGLSGVLHGLFVAGIVGSFRARTAESAVLLVLVAAKLVYEFLFGPLPGSESSAGGNVITGAHLFGAVAGSIAAGLVLAAARIRPSPGTPI